MGEASKLSWNIADPPQSRDVNGRNEPSGTVKKSNAKRAKPAGEDAVEHHGTRGPSSSRSASDGGGVGEGVDATSSSGPPDNEAQGEKPPPVGPDGAPIDPPKASITTRMKNGCIRFGAHTKDALFNSWINVLLLFVPAGIAVNFAGLNPAVIFAMNAVAIVPLAGMLSYATETVASRLGETLAALLNVSFGNAVELIIFIIALAKNEIRITQAAILGSILANLLLILGMAFLFGGLRYQEQIYNSTITQMSACLLSLSVMSLLLPTAFHASFSDNNTANTATLQVSRGTSVILLLIYVLFLVFQLKSHAYLYKATPQQIIDEESHPGLLHDVLNSSSSSSSSDTSSDSDSSSSSASHHTGMRIKRAFRRRRRFSISSKDAGSVSGISSPTAEQDNFDPTISRRPSTINPVLEGDDADADDEKPRRGAGNGALQFNVPEGETAPPTDRKSKRRHKKKHHRRRRTQSQSRTEGSEITPAPRSRATSIRDGQQQKVEFADEKDEEKRAADEQEAEEKRIEAERTKVQSRNPFNIRVNREALRPQLPKMLSNNVFTLAPGATAPPPPTKPVTPAKPSNTRTVSMGPRRVRSLPDRMNTAQALSALSQVPSRTNGT